MATVLIITNTFAKTITTLTLQTSPLEQKLSGSAARESQLHLDNKLFWIDKSSSLAEQCESWLGFQFQNIEYFVKQAILSFCSRFDWKESQLS